MEVEAARDSEGEAHGEPKAFFPRLTSLLGAPVAGTGVFALGDRFRTSLDASLGVPGLPGTATGQAALVTGANPSRARGRHLHGYPGPALRAWIDAQSNLLQRFAGTLLTGYRQGGGPPPGRETVLRYVARMAGDVPRRASGTGGERGLTPDAGFLAHPDDNRAAESLGRELMDLARQATRGFAVFETDLLDRAGHVRDRREREKLCVGAVTYMDAFLAGCIGSCRNSESVVLVSDHGNVEEPETKGHTRSRVPLLAFGPITRTGIPEGDLTAFAPWLESYLAK